MVVAVFGDAHAHAEALDAVIGTAEACGVQVRSRKPSARRGDVQCWHGSPRNAVHEYVGASNAAACLRVQRGALGLVGHTHVAAAWRHTPGGASAVKIAIGVPLDLAGGKWLLNPGAVGAPSRSRLGWWDALDLQAADGAYWLLLDLQRHTATWRPAPYDPAPARLRARALGLDDGGWSTPRTVTGARGGHPYEGGC